MKTQLYRIRAITNLHPGSGDAGYGVVDKLVQRDPITGFPTIYMSAVKGAMREYFKHLSEEQPEDRTPLKKNDVIAIFGADPKAQSDEVLQGKLRFVSADLLAIPRMSDSADSGKPYELCCVDSLLEAWRNKAALFGVEVNKVFEQNEITCIDMGAFKELCEELPVVARNYLDNGESKNLWYEEFVPRETIFGMIVQGPEDLMEIFSAHVDDHLIQLGGNATVGYGYCLFTKMNEA